MKDCGFDDTSMTFGTPLEYTLIKIFDYRDISDLLCNKIGGHLSRWPPLVFYYYDNSS